MEDLLGLYRSSMCWMMSRIPSSPALGEFLEGETRPAPRSSWVWWTRRRWVRDGKSTCAISRLLWTGRLIRLLVRYGLREEGRWERGNSGRVTDGPSPKLRLFRLMSSVASWMTVLQQCYYNRKILRGIPISNRFHGTGSRLPHL